MPTVSASGAKMGITSTARLKRTDDEAEQEEDDHHHDDEHGAFHALDRVGSPVQQRVGDEALFHDQVDAARQAG